MTKKIKGSVSPKKGPKAKTQHSSWKQHLATYVNTYGNTYMDDLLFDPNSERWPYDNYWRYRHYYHRSDIQIEKTHKSLNLGRSKLDDILLRHIKSLPPEEIARIIFSKNTKKKELDSEVLASVLLCYPSLSKDISINDLTPVYRVAVFCRTKDNSVRKSFDANAVDLRTKHYRFVFNERKPAAVKHLLNQMSDANIAKYIRAYDWANILLVHPKACTRFNISMIRHKSDLRHLILEHPMLMHTATIDDMKNSVIDGPEWIRIITKLDIADRVHFPAGIKEWAEKDIFKLKLRGRRMKKFNKGWSEGLKASEDTST